MVEGDAADRFLQRQGLQVHPSAAWPDALRLHPALEYWHTDSQGPAACIGTFPALLAKQLPEAQEQPEVEALGPMQLGPFAGRAYLTPVQAMRLQRAEAEAAAAA